MLDFIGGAEGDRTPDLRIANGKKAIFMDGFLGLENHHFLPKTLTKMQPRTGIQLLRNTTFRYPF